MFRKRHSAFRRAAWIALVALFLQIVVPVLHHPASASIRDGTAAANLCLAPGSTPTAPTDNDKSPAHKTPPCAVCQTLHLLGGGFAPPSGVALVPARSYGTLLPQSLAASFPRARSVSDCRARAPPESA